MPPLILTSLLMLWAQTATRTPQVFPDIDTVTSRPPVDVSRREWYTSHLVAMAETQLPNGPGETYRFLWLRSFHHPLVVRVSCRDNACRLTAVRTSGKGGYEPGSIVERRTRAISAAEVKSFRGMLSQVRFWDPQLEQPHAIANPDGTETVVVKTDGAQWVLEGRRGQSYHLWDMWSPSAAGPEAVFRELGLFLVRLSGLAVRQDEIY